MPGRGSACFFDSMAWRLVFKVWLNGEQVEESTASAFNRHTFEVTDHLSWGAEETHTLAL
ncbi:MAG: hypothetical protein J6386_03715 [Candidatus Synoicihabitans palmerolidicus]|nr:hypothetical protein [Candidatus Synoicihabitans palmerolidicus]